MTLKAELTALLKSSTTFLSNIRKFKRMLVWFYLCSFTERLLSGTECFVKGSIEQQNNDIRVFLKNISVADYSVSGL